MSERTTYDFTDDKLVQEFMNACERAGTSDSDLVVDIMEGAHFEEANYLKGVLLSRLHGKKPPFKRGDVVKTKPNTRSFRADQYWGPEIIPGKNYTIWRVLYIWSIHNDKEWSLEFRGVNGDLGTPYYDAEKFEIVGAVVLEGAST